MLLPLSLDQQCFCPISERATKNVPVDIEAAQQNTTWDAFWGLDGYYDSARAVTYNGSHLFLTGYTASYGTADYNAFLLCYDLSGNLEWQTVFDDGSVTRSYDVLTWAGYEYFVGSVVDEGAFVACYKEDKHQWNKTFGNEIEAKFYGIDMDLNDNIYAVGTDDIISSEHLILVKMNTSGHQIWNYTWSAEDPVYARDVCTDSLGNVYVTGYVMDPPEYTFLKKLDSSGNELWSTTVGKNSTDQTRLSLDIDSNNDVYVTSRTSNDGSSVTLLTKYHSNGTEVWNATWGNDYGPSISYGIDIDFNDQIWVTGEYFEQDRADSDSFVLLYDDNGNLLLELSWATMSEDKGRDIVIDEVSNIYITGETSSQDPHSDVLLTRFTMDETPPDECTLTSPTDSDITNDETPTLRWDVPYDPSPSFGIGEYEVQIDNNSAFSSGNLITGWSQHNNYTVPSPLTDGEWYWRVRAYDNVDNIGSWANSTFTIDTTKPIVETFDDYTYEWGSSDNEIELSASDLHPDSVEILDNDSLLRTYNWFGGSITVSLDGLSYGSHNITFVFYDKAENWNSSQIVVTVEDTTPPLITGPEPLTVIELTSSTITWTVEDARPVHYRIERNGTEIDSGYLTGTTVSIEVDTSQTGTFNYTLVAWDAEGQISTHTVIVTVQVDMNRIMTGYLTVGGAAVAAVLGLLGLVLLSQRKKQSSVLREAIEGKQSIEKSVLAESTGLGEDKLEKVVERADFAALSADEMTVINLDRLSSIILSDLEENGLIKTDECASSYGVDVSQIDRIIESSRLDVIKLSSGNYALRKHILTRVVNRVDAEGVLDIAEFAEEIGTTLDEIKPYLDEFLEENQLIVEGTALVITTDWLTNLKEKIAARGQVRISEFSEEVSVSEGYLRYLLTTYVSGSFDARRSTFIAGAVRPEVDIILEERRPSVKALRGGEFVGNRFRYKVKVQNESDYVITDVTVTLLSYPRDTLKLEGDSSRTITKIDPKGFRSPTFDFLPTEDCVKGDVIASVSYVDSKGQAHSITTEPFTIRAVCDLLRPESMSPEEFELKLTDMRHGEMMSRVEDWTPEEMHEKTLQILKDSNFYQVTSDSEMIGEHIESKIEGWAKGVYTGKGLGVQITISGRPQQKGATCKVRLMGEDEAMIMPAIDEITQKLAAWLCPKCGGHLELEQVNELKAGRSVCCPFCGVTIDR